mmetsp:Transcript_84918/g.218752  ORF Transcript_84918/g.218752 Transcript_84918/m.218752 type:complete len:604 (+) Transcript_84918:1963-3774(+)
MHLGPVHGYDGLGVQVTARLLIVLWTGFDEEEHLLHAVEGGEEVLLVKELLTFLVVQRHHRHPHVPVSPHGRLVLPPLGSHGLVVRVGIRVALEDVSNAVQDAECLLLPVVQAELARQVQALEEVLQRPARPGQLQADAFEVGVCVALLVLHDTWEVRGDALGAEMLPQELDLGGLRQQVHSVLAQLGLLPLLLHAAVGDTLSVAVKHLEAHLHDNAGVLRAEVVATGALSLQDLLQREHHLPEQRLLARDGRRVQEPHELVDLVVVPLRRVDARQAVHHGFLHCLAGHLQKLEEQALAALLVERLGNLGARLVLVHIGREELQEKHHGADHVVADPIRRAGEVRHLASERRALGIAAIVLAIHQVLLAPLVHRLELLSVDHRQDLVGLRRQEAQPLDDSLQVRVERDVGVPEVGIEDHRQATYACREHDGIRRVVREELQEQVDEHGVLADQRFCHLQAHMRPGRAASVATQHFGYDVDGSSYLLRRGDLHLSSIAILLRIIRPLARGIDDQGLEPQVHLLLLQLRDHLAAEVCEAAAEDAREGHVDVAVAIVVEELPREDAVALADQRRQGALPLHQNRCVGLVRDRNADELSEHLPIPGS